MVNLRFVDLAPPYRIVEAVSFVTTDLTKTHRRGHVFPVHPVYAEWCSVPDGTAAIWELERCIMDALRPWAF